MIQFDCPSCGQHFTIHEKNAGRRGVCNRCKSEIRIPGVQAESHSASAIAAVPAAPIAPPPSPVLEYAGPRPPSATTTIPAPEQSHLESSPALAISLSALLAMGSAVMLILGVFAPAVSVPILGTVNTFNQGWIGYALLALAAAAGVVAVMRMKRIVLIVGLVALLSVGGNLIYVEHSLSQSRSDIATQLAGNPFADLGTGMIDAIHLDWGWSLLFAGSVGIVAAGALPRIQIKTA